MSLELAITENANAIRDLIAAISKGVPTTAAQVAAVVEQAPKETKKAKATVATNGASSTQEGTSPEAVPADAAAQQPAPEAAATAPVAASVSYEDVKHAIVKLSGSKGRDAVVALLTEFGAGKGPDLKPEQFAEFIAKASQLVAA